MIFLNEKQTEWVSHLYGDYANCSWKVGSSYISVASASGQQEADIEWDDIPSLVSDLMLLYEQAREHMVGRSITERKMPNLR